MSLTITLELLTGSYDAGDADDRRSSEWPPHPGRLFCALISAARSQSDREALIWLEGLEAPLIVAARQGEVSRSSSYVVTNQVESEGGSQTHPGRSNQMRVRARSFPESPVARFVWDGVDPGDDLVERFDQMCRRVPYLGRSTGVAVLAASATRADVAGEATSGPAERPKDLLQAHAEGPWQVFEPCDQSQEEFMVRVPYAGYLAQLDGLFAEDRPAWQASRYLPYRTRPREAVASHQQIPEPSVYRDVVVFRFVGFRPGGRLVTDFTEAFRRRVLKSAGPTAPAVLHGHGADGRPHVAFLALPSVATSRGATVRESERHADGHLLGLAVAVPDLPEPERRAVLAAVLGLRRRGEGGELDTVDLAIPRIGQLELLYAPGLVRPWGATPERWRKGSSRWVSATPVVLDRFPKRGESIEDILLRSVREAGLPDVVQIEASVDPLLPGAVAMRPVDLPAKLGKRVFRHVALTFARPVAGPVMLGAGRYLGIGLFSPILGEAADRAADLDRGTSERAGSVSQS